MIFKPLGKAVLVEVLDDKQDVIGGIHIPDKCQAESQKGKVVSLGQVDDPNYVFDIEPGDTIILPKYSKTKVTIGDKLYYIVEVDQIVARID